MALSLSHKVVKDRRKQLKRKYNNYARQLKKKKIIMYLRRELSTSTTHGIPYIVDEEIHWSERFFWILSFTFSIILIFYLLAAQFQRFIETPTVMSVEMDYFNWNVTYPAFTLCPNYNLKADMEAFSILSNETVDRTGRNLDSYLNSILAANIENLDELDLPASDTISLIDPKEYTKIAMSVFKQFDESSLTTSNNLPISVDVAMTELGLCHVINSNIAMFDNPLRWHNSGIYTKTNIELSVHDREFFAQMMNYGDIYKVIIHSPDDTILSTTSSYTHTLRGFMSFGVQVWSSRISDELRAASIRLRKCRFHNEPISERYPIYSYSHCMLECRIKMIVKLCGCVPHFYKPLEDERICNLAELKCVARYKKEIITLSSSAKTLVKFRDTTNLPKYSRDCGCMSKCESDTYQKDYENFIPQSDMNRLRIGISSYPKVRVVRNIIFSFSDILLKIGGAINLCIGSSIISFLELIVTILRMPINNLVLKIQGNRA